MINVLLGMYEVVYTVFLMYEVTDGCGLFLSLLSMCEVLGLHMYIALVAIYWDYEYGLMMSL